MGFATQTSNNDLKE